MAKLIVCGGIDLLKVKVSLKCLGTEGVSLHRDRRYSSKQEIDLPAPDDFILKALREALHVVTERSNIDMVRLLVEKGDDTEAKDKWQQGN